MEGADWGHAAHLKVPVLERRRPAGGHVEILLESPVLAAARPGQFAHVRTPGTLRRPISFSRLDAGTGRAGLLFRVVGSGTSWLAGREPGEMLDVLGPLGRGFPEPPAGRPWVLVGGGVGIPPLYAQAERAGAARALGSAVLGARSAGLLVMEEDFRALGLASVTVTTDDGSRGGAGTVLGPLAAWLERHPGGVVYACGPTAMLRGVAELTAGRAEAYVALEQRMGCGMGACLACAVLAHGPGGPQYRRVCHDGPVFRAEELVW